MKTVLTAGAGLASSAVTQSLNLNDLTSTIVQVVIGIVTIINLFKKQKNEKKTPQN